MIASGSDKKLIARSNPSSLFRTGCGKGPSTKSGTRSCASSRSTRSTNSGVAKRAWGKMPSNTTSASGKPIPDLAVRQGGLKSDLRAHLPAEREFSIRRMANGSGRSPASSRVGRSSPNPLAGSRELRFQASRIGESDSASFSLLFHRQRTQSRTKLSSGLK